MVYGSWINIGNYVSHRRKEGLFRFRSLYCILSNQRSKSCKIKKAKKFLQSLPSYGHATTLFKLNLSAVPYFKNLTVLVHNSCNILFDTRDCSIKNETEKMIPANELQMVT